MGNSLVSFLARKSNQHTHARRNTWPTVVCYVYAMLDERRLCIIRLSVERGGKVRGKDRNFSQGVAHKHIYI